MTKDTTKTLNDIYMNIQTELERLAQVSDDAETLVKSSAKVIMEREQISERQALTRYNKTNAGSAKTYEASRLLGILQDFEHGQKNLLEIINDSEAQAKK